MCNYKNNICINIFNVKCTKNNCRGGRHGTWRQRRKRGHRQCRYVINKTLNNDEHDNNHDDDDDDDGEDNDGGDGDGKELIIISKILLEDIACGNTREPLERPSLHFLMLQSTRQMIMVQNLGVTKFLEMTRVIIT